MKMPDRSEIHMSEDQCTTVVASENGQQRSIVAQTKESVSWDFEQGRKTKAEESERLYKQESR